MPARCHRQNAKPRRAGMLHGAGWWLVAVWIALAAGAPARPASALEVPVDLGIGPAATWWTGPIGDEQPAHLGLKLSLAAVLDRAFIQANAGRVPARYRALAARMEEIRYKPSIWIPDSLTISPKLQHTGMYGATWRPYAVGMPLARGATSLDLSAGLLVTYTFIHSDALSFAQMHFLRPGVDLTLRWEIPVLPKAFLIAVGWSSQFYVPQVLGGSVLDVGHFDRGSIWHVGQAFVTLHWRVPYEVRL